MVDSTIEVIYGGMLTSLQDLGRCGYQKYGVIAGGAMDTYALRLANLLVGNAQAEAALEITFQGPVLQLAAGMMIAFMGAGAVPRIAGEMVPLNRPVYIKKNCQLDFG
ncbi:MAG: KipI antagonist, partial [Selenomonadaceae bacterium]